MDSKRGTIIAACAVAILALAVLASALFGGDDETPEPAGDPAAPSSSASLNGPAEPGGPGGTGAPESPAAPGTSVVPAKASARAEKAILAYTQYSYADPSYRTWVDRVGALSTESFAHELEELFVNPSEADYWSRDVVEHQREARTTVQKVVLDQEFHENTKNRITFTVTYETSVRSDEADGWSVPVSSLSQWVTVVRKGQSWKVDLIEPTTSR